MFCPPHPNNPQPHDYVEAWFWGHDPVTDTVKTKDYRYPDVEINGDAYNMQLVMPEGVNDGEIRTYQWTQSNGSSIAFNIKAMTHVYGPVSIGGEKKLAEFAVQGW